MYGVKRIKHKFGAKRCEVDNIKFPSTLEKNCWLRLKHHEKEGRILFFLRQVPFDLDAGKHHVDFAVFTTSGEVLFIESKGRDLEAGRLRRLQVQNRYSLEIHVVTKPEQIDALLL